jgi:hypothetical protein
MCYEKMLTDCALKVSVAEYSLKAVILSFQDAEKGKLVSEFVSKKP